jgi:hypothetical protein
MHLIRELLDDQTIDFYQLQKPKKTQCSFIHASELQLE